MNYRELPPTAGLPPSWRDLLPGPATLAQALGDWLHLPEPLLTCSGTAALVIALDALKSQSPRRVVILPAYTCPLVLLAVAHCQLEARLCDLAPDHFDLDPAHLARLIDDDVLAVIPTHLGGRVADVAGITALAHALGVFVIEDAAQALGAESEGTSVGLAGDIGFFSLAAGKGLSIFEGGLLFSRDAGLRAALRQSHDRLIQRDWQWSGLRLLQMLGYTALYNPRGLYPAYGQPLRQSLEQGDKVAAVGDDFDRDIPLHTVSRWRQVMGRHALARLPAFIAQTRAQAERRLAQLDTLGGLHVMRDANGNTGTWPFFMVLMKTEAERDAVLNPLWTRGLGVSRLFIHTLPDYDYLTDCLPPTASSQDTPHARDFAARMFTITNSPWLSDDDFGEILAVIRKVQAGS